MTTGCAVIVAIALAVLITSLLIVGIAGAFVIELANQGGHHAR